MGFEFEPGIEYFEKIFKYYSKFEFPPSVQLFGGEPTMRKDVLKLITLTIMLIGLPLAGILFSGQNIYNYLEFPPKTRYVAHAPFSIQAFLGSGLVIIALILPLFHRSLAFIIAKTKANIKREYLFPWWGYVGLITGIASWILAWTRSPRS